MPTSRGDSWFITLSTALFEEINLAEVAVRVTAYPNYFCIRENGTTGSHPHIHAVIWSSKEESQQAIRKRFSKCLNVSPTPLNIKVVPVYMRDKLIGGYLTKDKTYTILHSSITSNELENLVGLYKHAEKVTPLRKIRHVPASHFPDEVVKFARSHDLILRSPDDLSKCIGLMYLEGFRSTQSLRGIRVLWGEIRLIQGRPVNVFEMEGPYSTQV